MACAASPIRSTLPSHQVSSGSCSRSCQRLQPGAALPNAKNPVNMPSDARKRRKMEAYRRINLASSQKLSKDLRSCSGSPGTCQAS